MVSYALNVYFKMVRHEVKKNTSHNWMYNLCLESRSCVAGGCYTGNVPFVFMLATQRKQQIWVPRWFAIVGAQGEKYTKELLLLIGN